MIIKKISIFSVLFFCFLPVYGQSEKLDQDLMNSLKSEANHDTERRRAFQSDRDNKKVFDNEREKGLSLFLEEQEKWDLSREKGLAEHKKQKRILSPADDGPEFLADQKEKKKVAAEYEKSRQLVIQTKQKVKEQAHSPNDSDELKELNLAENRPRYDLRKRGKNKWAKGNSQSGGSKSSSAPAFDDFPLPNGDFNTAPPPLDSFDEIPPAPPMNYDSANGGFPYGGTIDSGFGDVPPPPPPPPMDYDF